MAEPAPLESLLRYTLTASEQTLRSYDVKVQIASAVFAVSGASFLSQVPALLLKLGAWPTALMAVLYVLAILLFLFVIFPVEAPRHKTDAAEVDGLYFVRPGAQLDPATYITRLQSVDEATLLATEIHRLARIRARKQQWTVFALAIAALFYTAALVAYLRYLWS